MTLRSFCQFCARMALRAEGKASEAEMLYTEAVEAGLTATKQQIRAILV